ncbi:hypothetical protein GPECTOR_721g877 [Gonium pectorale]|uniref:Transposable element P transposase-like RNase H domain-containing protein n=1 Tax=Gonium pectorale TaxID=33097 RepID=A0A150FU77_GONPE|nr:hypothetical protein GPECTOR_721g877 [Gonium pectorale]|eukprot:KXZ41149.1 hypothetical protein GPECTOR_721g877 [Gonium pectorale]
MLLAYYRDHAYNNETVRHIEGVGQAAFFKRVSALYSELSGEPCSDRQIKTHITKLRNNELRLYGCKRGNVFAAQIACFLASDEGRHVTQLLQSPEDPVTIFREVSVGAFSAAAIMAQAELAAGSLEEYQIPPLSERLFNIRQSFVPGPRTGHAVWPQEVLDAWRCVLLAGDQFGKQQLRFECHLGCHKVNELCLVLESDLSYELYHAGAIARLPPDGPALKVLRAMSLRAALSDFQSQQERAAAAAQQACESEASNALEATKRARQLEQQLQVAEKQLLDLRMANSSLEAALKASEEKLQQAQAAVEASRANMTQLPEGQCAVLDKLLRSPVAQECLSRDPGLALMWLDQLQYLERVHAGGKAINGMRWHASTLRFGLTLFNKGGAKLYEELAHQVPLPSVSQLRNYKRFTADGPGWNSAAAATCAEVVKAAGADTRGGLAFDEMKLNSGLVFNVATDALVGWADLDAGNEVDHLKGLLNPETDAAVSSIDRSVATHVLHFTFTSLGPKPTRYSVAYFFTNGIKALDLASTVSDGVRLLSAAGLNVTYTVCDGASENRAWMEKAADRELARSIAKETGIELPSSNVTSHLRCFRHPANPTQPVIMLTDGPHLAKKGRNNLEKSYGGTGVKGRNTAEMRWPDGQGGWLFTGLELFADWVEREGWKADGRPAPPEAITTAARNLSGYVKLFLSTQLALDRTTPIKTLDDKLLDQLLINGTAVYRWHEALRKAAPKASSRPSGDTAARDGLSAQCCSDFQVTCFGAVALARFYLQTGGTSVIMASLNQNCVENAFSQLRGHGQNRMPDAQRVIDGEQSLRLDEILRVVNRSRAAGKRTASYAQACDALLDALPIGQITEPCSALVSVFEDVQKRLITHVQSAQSILRSGPLAIRLWIHEVRHDSSAWQQFRAACEQMGLSELACKVPDVKRDQLDEQLRALMGRLGGARLAG